MASKASEQDEDKIASGKSKTSPDIKAARRISNEIVASQFPSMNSKDFIVSLAASIASEPLQNYESNVWGVLTAISNNARKRRQGINLLLTSYWHCFGRLPHHNNFQIESNAVSDNHCNIFHSPKQAQGGGAVSVFVEDIGTNETFLNWEKLKKRGRERVQHGDIISLVAPPEHDDSFAFVYRQVIGNNPSLPCMNSKRKAEDITRETKRLKGIGIGGPDPPDGPISLDDFKSLQQSNTKLRNQLRAQVHSFNIVRSAYRTLVEHHESVNKLSAEQKHDLGEKLSTSLQSLCEANEIIKRLKSNEINVIGGGANVDHADQVVEQTTSSLRKPNPKVFFDLTVEGRSVGRLVMELFADTTPKTAENFRALCTGEKGIGKKFGIPLHYKGSNFQNLCPNLCFHGGYITDGEKTENESIYEGKDGYFENENFIKKHSGPGILSMMNHGEDTNGSEFMISMIKDPMADLEQVVVGQVVQGLDVLWAIIEEIRPSNLPSKSSELVVIADCGQIS